MILSFDSSSGNAETMVRSLMESVQRAIETIPGVSSAASGIGYYEDVEEATSGDSDSSSSIIDYEEVFNAVYPVGAIYISTNETEPSSLFGGTWVQIQDTFLLSAGSTYSAGSTGGEATHLLTAAELPTHEHSLGERWRSGSGLSSAYAKSDDCGLQEIGTVGAGSCGNQAHNNMPPYLAVYMWKRTA